MVDLKSWLPPRRVHLLGGVSDAGKTRFILPAMLAWADAPSWVYVSGDRPRADVEDTMADMGMLRDSVPILPAFGRDNKNWLRIVLAVKEMRPLPELLIIEGFGDLCDDPQTRVQVRNFMSDVSAYLEPTLEFPQGLTVLGVMESPKLKPHERYQNPRQRISGVSAWAYHASTVILIEPDDPECMEPTRTLFVCLKGTRRVKLSGTFSGANRLIFG
jgi:hypothetical protein